MEQPLDYIFIDTDCYVCRFGYEDIEEVSDSEFSLALTAKDMDILSVSDEMIEAVCFPEIDGTVQVTHFKEEDSIRDSEEKDWFYKAYAATEVEIASSIPVVVRMERNESDMEQDPDAEIVDIDFRPLQSALDDKRIEPHDRKNLQRS